jgi:hypothetical protein
MTNMQMKAEWKKSERTCGNSLSRSSSENKAEYGACNGGFPRFPFISATVYSKVYNYEHTDQMCKMVDDDGGRHLS